MSHHWQTFKRFLLARPWVDVPATQPWLFRLGMTLPYGFATGAVGLAALATLYVTPLRDQPPTLLFFAAVILTSWYAGLHAGLWASILSIVAMDFFFVVPVYLLQLNLRHVIDFAAFAGATWLVSSLQGRWRRASRQLIIIERELEIARGIQQRLLPASEPALPGLEIAGRCQQASATGGDFYDYLPMQPPCLGVTVGDVSGHGLGPALTMAALRAYLRVLALTTTDPGQVLSQANRILCEEVQEGWFVTAFFLVLNPETRTLIYAGAGHEAYLLEPDTGVTELSSTGLPLGIAADREIRGHAPLALQPGQIVLVLSDGIVEAHPRKGKIFGAERAWDVVRAHRDRPAQEIVAALFHAAQTHAHGIPPQDDMTVVVIKVQAGT